jgi:hypothetical protein
MNHIGETAVDGVAGFALVSPWLPDGLLSYQKSQFGYILEGLGMENVGIFYDYLEYLTAIWYILWQFCTVCGHLVQFVVIWCSLWSFGTVCGHLVQFVVIWYSLWSFGIFFLFWYV